MTSPGYAEVARMFRPSGCVCGTDPVLRVMARVAIQSLYKMAGECASRGYAVAAS